MQIIEEAMNMLGFSKTSECSFSLSLQSSHNVEVRTKIVGSRIHSEYWINGAYKHSLYTVTATADIEKFIRTTERNLRKFGHEVFGEIIITEPSARFRIMSAINTRNIAADLVRVKSSNVWAYGLNVRTNKDRFGDLVVQFKSPTGGAGDVYMYYDVPVNVYRRWQSAPSKGHYFWLYIRNNYRYSKLTGDKRGKLRNAIN